MKVYISNYRNHWLSPYTICEKICFWREIDYDEPWVKVINRILDPVMTGVMKIGQFIRPRIEYIKIDRWDTWSMDNTLALIILPMLKQLQATKHGAPNVDDEDVPDDLKRTAVPEVVDWETDSNYFMRWDWVLGEMIFAFEHLVDDSWEEEFWTGEYGKGKSFDEMMNSNTRVWDKDGQQVVEDRINNGLKLFGKYYRALWD